MNNIKRSVCPHDCPDTCGLLVHVKKGRVAKVRGDPEHPFTRGVVCSKLAQYPARVYNAQRITTPLRRAGIKGEGRFSPISWDQALDEIVHHLKEIASRFGPEAILPYSYGGTMGMIHRFSGHALFHRLGASRLKRTICSTIGQAGFAASFGPTLSTDIESTVNADLIIIWGSNTLSTNLHAWRFFTEARNHGSQIVVIDPYRNRTARRSNKHLRLLPGTDAALALGIMHTLISEDLLDLDFIEQNTIGFEALRQRVREYPPERAAEICGVPKEEIVFLARNYGKARAPYIRLGYGLSRQLRGGMAIRTIALLPALVGAFRKRGGGITFSTSTTSKLNTDAWERPDLAPDNVRWINMVQLGDALTELDSPPIKALYVYLSNPAVVAPDSGKVIAGLAQEDLFTVVHEHFLTDTARFADIVLPGTTFLEHTDVYWSYGHYYVQMAQPVIPPLGECRSPMHVFQDLAERFQFDEECFTLSEEEVVRRILPNDSPLFQDITLDNLALGKPLRVNVPPNPFEDGFPTPSGKVEFYSSTLAEMGLDPLPDGKPSIDEEGLGRYPLQMITPTRHHFLNSTFNEVDALRNKAGRPTILIHPLDAEARNISKGLLTRVFNDRGQCYLYAEVTEDTAHGVTVVEGLYWPKFTPGNSGINRLTSQQLGDMGESCAFHCNLVEVESAESASPESLIRGY